MKTYRVEIEEKTTVTKTVWVWVEAENEDDARQQVEDVDWREFDPTNEVHDVSVVSVREDEN